ncbi:PREDICTED: melanoma-associated antigen 10-like [Elephantulus edwardii]|uniref:melanoma-associated antigen 10-like n=1 Tax=Elephantulus edwardii TaxID=28737 RepID=UPI0003F07A0C|nr:PREDICTED: melanoma-associated antigen 10-like [Elephantulus edwardii]
MRSKHETLGKTEDNLPATRQKVRCSTPTAAPGRPRQAHVCAVSHRTDVWCSPEGSVEEEAQTLAESKVRTSSEDYVSSQRRGGETGPHGLPPGLGLMEVLGTASSVPSSPSHDPETLEEVSDLETPPSSPRAISSLISESEASSTFQEGKSLGTGEGQPDVESIIRGVMQEKVADLLHFLLLKYRTKGPITKAELLAAVTKQYEDYFPVIFKKVCECIELVFGIRLEKDDPAGNSFVFHNTLDFTSEDILHNEHGVPRSGVLLLILSVIFMEGNRATEEKIWQVLNKTGVYAEKLHPVYGDPRQFITRGLVEKKYLLYQQVLNSDPARYEFRWGPRAHAETSKMKVLEFLARINDTVPSAFPTWYEGALRDEEERAKARTSSTDATAATASSNPSAKSSNLSGPSGDSV